MAVYVVQARGNDRVSLERATLVRDGFSWAAFVFGPFWLLYRRAWLPLLAWIAIEIGFIWLVVPHVGTAGSVAVDGLAHLLLGLEASRLVEATGARRAAVVDVVEGRDRGEAEIRFFRRLPPDPPPLPHVARTVFPEDRADTLA